MDNLSDQLTVELLVPEKTLFNQLEWMQVWLAALTALWGGLVSYFRRVQAGHKHSAVSAIIHMASSGFAGLMCWLGCLQFDVPGPLTAICTGLAGHMGAEFIKIIEARFASKLMEPLSTSARRATDTNPGAQPAGPSQGRRAEDTK